MKYMCFGYMDQKKWKGWSQSEREAYIDSCFDYDDVLRRNNHYVAGEALAI